MKRGLIIMAAALILCSVCLIDVGYSYTPSTENTGDAVSEYVTLSQNDYEFVDGGRCGINTITADIDIVSTEFISSPGASNTQVRITVPRSSLLSGGPLDLWVKTYYELDNHYGHAKISVSTGSDSGNIVISNDTTAERGITVASSGSAYYILNVTITGLKHAGTFSVSFSKTVYQIDRATDLMSISGVLYAGKMLGDDKLRGDGTNHEGTIDVRLTSTGFSNQGNTGWLYVLELTDGVSSQYAYSSNGSTWSYSNGSSSQSSLQLTSGVLYDTKLYFAGVKDASGNAFAQLLPINTGNAIITNGTITFTMDTAA